MTADVYRLPQLRYEAGQSSPYHQNPPASTNPDYEYSISFRTLRDWARQLADNSSIVQSVLSTRVANGVGAGLTYEPLTRDRKGNLNEELNDAIRRLHTAWSERADITGEMSRQQIEQLAWNLRDLDGECFARRVNRRFTKDQSEIAYHIQVMPAEWVPGNLIEQRRDGKRIMHGILQDEWGTPLSYFVDPNGQDIFSQPGTFLNSDALTSIPADQVWHVKRTEKARQTRGVTLFHAIIFRIADVAEYQEAHRLAARASADLFCAITRSADWSEADESETSADGTRKRSWDFDHLQMIDGLDRGEGVNFLSPSHPNQNAVDFVREELRAIAAACDVGFSQISQFYDRSFSAQRMERVDVWRKTERDRKSFITRFAKPGLYDWPVRVAQLENRLPARALRKTDPATLFDARIEGPMMPVIDPVVERKALEMDQLNKWDSRQGIIRQLGKFPQDVDAEINTDPMKEQVGAEINTDPMKEQNEQIPAESEPETQDS